MSDGAAAAWAHVFLQALEVIGGICGMVGGMAVLLFRRTFATRDDLLAYFKDHGVEHHELEKRLAAGENRFTEIAGAIRMVQTAAEQATKAADQAHAAADRMERVHVDIAALRGDVKALEVALRPIERLTMGMVEGHMAEGRANPTRTRS
jgi:hypothetical protein